MSVKRKGLICGILENKDIGNCSNNGISSRHDSVLVVMDNPRAQIFEEDPKRPTVKIVRRNIFGKEYIHAEPVNQPKEGNIGWIMGGCFITTSDSRFSNLVSPYPVPLHDRQETQEEYDMLSS